MLIQLRALQPWSYPGRVRWQYGAIVLGLAAALIGLAYGALFVPGLTLGWLLVPLVIGIMTPNRPMKAAMMGVTLGWPIAVCSLGLVGLGHSLLWVSAGAVLLLTSIMMAASIIGLIATTLTLLVIPVFPASPLLVLAAATQSLPYPVFGFLGLLVVAFVLEIRGIGRQQLGDPRVGPASSHPRKVIIVVFMALGVGVAQMAESRSSSLGEVPTGWQTVKQPPAITEHGTRWRLRDAIHNATRPGSLVILGENILDADDAPVLAFWCELATSADITMLIGVREPQRSTLWRFDANSCAASAYEDRVFLRSRLGVPGHTGSWFPAESYPKAPLYAPPAGTFSVTGRDVLLCLEAFLPSAWLDGPWRSEQSQQAGAEFRPVVLVLSNDRAFGAWADNIRQLRRKAARALASLAVSQSAPVVLHAETDHSFIIYSPPSAES